MFSLRAAMLIGYLETAHDGTLRVLFDWQFHFDLRAPFEALMPGGGERPDEIKRLFRWSRVPDWQANRVSVVPAWDLSALTEPKYQGNDASGRPFPEWKATARWMTGSMRCKRLGVTQLQCSIRA
jgi:hypothetical protein